MIIGFDGSRAFVKNRTGTENYSYNLLKNLAKIDTVNKYYVYVRSGYKNSENNWPKNFSFKVINFPRLWTQAGLAVQTFFDPLNILFVPAHTFPLIHRPGLKIVMTVHDLGAEYLPALHNLKQRLYLNWITNYQLTSATKLIAVSEATKQDLIKRTNVREKNIQVIYEGIDQNNNAENEISISKSNVQVDILKHYDIVNQKYFLFVGTIQPRKNLARIIKAFAAFAKVSQDKNTKLILVGQKGWLSEELYDLPGKLEIKDQIKFAGRVADSDLKILYKNALALIFPSLFEGFGLPILEAMKNGCPVITSNISSMPEVAGEAAVLVNPEKTEEILDAMLNLAKNDALRDNMIVKGNKRASEFTWEKCARETLSLLERILTT